MGICSRGSCFSLLVRARARALLSEKQVGSGPGWMQLPWQMLVLLSQPHGLISAFLPTQAMLPALGKRNCRGQMVLPQPGNASHPVRDFFLPGSCSKNFVLVFFLFKVCI